MKNFSKQEALIIITEVAKEYESELANRRFRIAYWSKGTIKEDTVLFQRHHFLHMTGVNCVRGISPRKFYDRCLSGHLSINDFELPRDDNVTRKLTVLHMLPGIFKGPSLRGTFNNSGLWIDADYFVGPTRGIISVGFRDNGSYDIPVTLYNEDVRRLTRESDRVLAVWRSDPNQRVCNELVFLANGVNEQTILKSLT